MIGFSKVWLLMDFRNEKRDGARKELPNLSEK